MRILYLHGLGSSGNSNTANILRKLLPNDEIFAPEIPINPSKVWDFLIKIHNEFNPNITIGTSLGGFYAMIYGTEYKIIVNPAMFPSKDIKDRIGLGVKPYFSERTNGATHYIINEKFINDLKELEDTFFKYNLDGEFREVTYGLFGDKDELLDHKNDFNELFKKTPIIMNGIEHRLNEEAITTYIIPIIESLRKD